MIRKTKKLETKPILFGLIVAVCIHLVFVFSGLLPGMYQLWLDLFPRSPVKKSTEVTMVTLSKSQWNQNRQAQTDLKVKQRENKLKEELAKKEEKPEEIKGQVVDLAPTKDNTPPKDARFLSNYNTNVEKESVSRYRTKDYQVAQPRPTSTEASKQKSKDPSLEKPRDKIAMLMKKRGDKKSAEASKEKALAFEIPNIKKHDPLKFKRDELSGSMATHEAKDPIKGNSDKLRLQPSLPKANSSLKGIEGQDDHTLAMLSPSNLMQHDMVNGAPANDHIRDIPKGDDTLLNSREFRYATFFNRVKRGVSHHWNVGEAYFKRDPYGNVYGIKDRYTLLNVVLDTSGSLQDVTVVLSSGLGFLDEEAISAFRGAAPFPNPPQGLIENDGRIRFQFGFFFEISGRPMIKGFRYDHSRRR